MGSGFKREDLVNAKAFNVGYKALGDRHFTMEKVDTYDEAMEKLTRWQENGWKTKILPYPFPPEKTCKVYLVAGSVKRIFHEGTEKECREVCELYHWEFQDENEFIWNMEIE